MTLAPPTQSFPGKALDAELIAPEQGPLSARPLRIALLGYRSHPFCGGQGIYLQKLSRALTAIGHQVDVISGPPYPELDDNVRLIKLPSLDLYAQESVWRAWRWQYLRSFTDCFEWWSKASGGFAEPYTFGRRVWRYLQKHRGDYDVVHDNQSLGWGLLNIQRAGIPLVATIHHPITRDLRHALEAAPNWQHRLLIKRWHYFLKMQAKVAQRLRQVVTVSAVSKRDIVEDFSVAADHIEVVHNGVDCQRFRPLEGISRDPNLLLTTASADQPLKGLRFLLLALKQLREVHPLLRLQVIGRCQSGGDTEALIAKLGLQEHVTFTSGISEEELVQHYGRAAIAVCPSLYEGFGLPAAEAMACAVPVVSSDGGALPEVVGDAGRVVPAGNEAALAEAIGHLLQDESSRQRLGADGRARMQQYFSWENAAHQLSKLYHQQCQAMSQRYADR